jgi:fucose permease
MLIYGYSLTMLSACNLTYMRDYYNVDYSQDTLLSTINGFFAIGGLLGSIITPYFIKITTKR